MILEKLFAYSTLLRGGLLSMEQYNSWLDEVYQNTTGEEAMLLELEICSNDLNKTISQINYFTNPAIENLDYSLVGQILFETVENKYSEKYCDLDDLADRAYRIWSMLPDAIRTKEPFINLCNIYVPRKEIVKIDVSEIKTMEELHITLKNNLNFPDFYGMNWNAFWDAITGLVQLPNKIVFEGWHNLKRKLPYGAKMIKKLLQECNDMYPESKSTILYKE